MTDGDADPLLELFRREVSAAVAVLTEGLAILAVDPDHPTDWETLERSARSARGSALIVGLADAAELAGAIGDVFAEARRDARLVTADRVAALLSAVDLLKALADGEATGQVAEVLARLSGTVVRVESSRPEVPVPLSPPGRGEEEAAVPATEAPLLELFREEVRSLTGTLSAGLVELEADPADPRRIEPLMRAAHSIKGAARIVAVEPGVAVAHVMEELLVAAQKGERMLGSADVDALLAGVDLLAELADADLPVWSAANARRVEACAVALHARLEGKPTPALHSERGT